MQINDLSARIHAHEPAILAAVQRVLQSGWFVLGPEVRQFEAAFAAWVGVPHCVGVANGTDAIELGLRALGVGAGDRVATVANAGGYCTTALAAIGATPEFMDVDAGTCNVGLAEVERALHNGVRAVVVTHLYGLAVADIAAIRDLCLMRGTPLFEDCAQAHGAAVGGVRVGSFGDAAAFSFYPTKNLGALGDAGAVTTASSAVQEALLRLRQYGWQGKYRVEQGGGSNSRLDELQAAILSTFLPHLDAANARRLQVAGALRAGIAQPGVRLPSWEGAEYVAHLFVVRTPRRDALRQHLAAREIACDVHYPVPDHRQPVFADRFAAVSLPQTERLAREVLTLPCYPEMTDGDVRRVLEAVNGWRQ